MNPRQSARATIQRGYDAGPIEPTNPVIMNAVAAGIQMQKPHGWSYGVKAADDNQCAPNHFEMAHVVGEDDHLLDEMPPELVKVVEYMKGLDGFCRNFTIDAMRQVPEAGMSGLAGYGDETSWVNLHWYEPMGSKVGLAPHTDSSLVTVGFNLLPGYIHDALSTQALSDEGQIERPASLLANHWIAGFGRSISVVTPRYRPLKHSVETEQGRFSAHYKFIPTAGELKDMWSIAKELGTLPGRTDARAGNGYSGNFVTSI